MNHSNLSKKGIDFSTFYTLRAFLNLDRNKKTHIDKKKLKMVQILLDHLVISTMQNINKVCS